MRKRPLGKKIKIKFSKSFYKGFSAGLLSFFFQTSESAWVINRPKTKKDGKTLLNEICELNSASESESTMNHNILMHSHLHAAVQLFSLKVAQMDVTHLCFKTLKTSWT